MRWHGSAAKEHPSHSTRLLLDRVCLLLGLREHRLARFFRLELHSYHLLVVHVPAIRKGDGPTCQLSSRAGGCTAQSAL